ncbi:hypothetical protein ACGFNU_20990 [Spirillospora sp. NPDC048911]|uniref:hypothetical protein n=1 Tax=Spirillospora sp. NPDC048911 TaxID=3364527 RepID=UPI003715D3D1
MSIWNSLVDSDHIDDLVTGLAVDDQGNAAPAFQADVAVATPHHALIRLALWADDRSVVAEPELDAANARKLAARLNAAADIVERSELP